MQRFSPAWANWRCVIDAIFAAHFGTVFGIGAWYDLSWPVGGSWRFGVGHIPERLTPRP